MRYHQIADHMPAFVLLLFQATVFLAPWAIVIWQSALGNVSAVANFSYLLAIMSPLCLLLGMPSRNFLLSTDKLTVGQGLTLRTLLALLGCLAAVVVGVSTELLVLAFAVYIAKVGEMLYDLKIVAALQQKHTQELLVTALRKVTVLLIAFVVAWSSHSLELTLLTLGGLFVVDSLIGRVTWQRLPHKFNKLVVTTLPLSLSALVFSVYFNIPRYILGLEQQNELLAIFTISSFLIVGLLVVTNALCQSRLAQWAIWFNEQRFSELKKNLATLFFTAMLGYVALQIVHIEFAYSLFWMAHNQLDQLDSEYPFLFHLIIALSFGALVFSFSNYLLMVINRHRLLFLITLGNTIITGALAVNLFQHFGIKSLIVLTCCSGLAHGAICLAVLLRHMKGAP